MKKVKELNAPPIIASAHKDWFDDLPEQLEKAVEDYNLPDRDEWGVLDELSSATQFEGVDVFGDASVYQAGEFIAPANVYVTLVYDPNSDDGVSFSDSYPAKVHFKILPKSKGRRSRIQVERVEVDTSSFYE